MNEKKSFGGEKRSYNRDNHGETRSYGQGGKPRGGKPSFGGERKSFGGKSSFGGERKSFNGSKTFGHGEGRPADGEKRPYSSDRKPFNGERKSFDGERKPFNGERKPFSGDRKPFNGERKSFDGERKPFNGDRKPFNGERKSFDGERKPFNGERKPFNGERKPFNSDRKPFNGERKSFDGERKPFNGERKPFNGERKSFDGERKPFNGERKPFNSERKPFNGERKSFDGERKPFNGERKPFNGERKPAFHSESRTFRPVAKPVSDGMATRRMALEIIRKVTENGAYASLLLDEKLTGSGFNNADRRLVARLVYDTLEHLIYLDHILNQVMAKPDTDIKLRNILRLAACQILLEDRIPESAATNTAVNLCKENEMEALAGVCNGILRNLIRRKEENALTLPDPTVDPIAYRSVKYSVPAWLVERLTADYGEEESNRLMDCRVNEGQTVRPNLMRYTDEEFEQLLSGKVWKSEKSDVPYAWHISGAADIGEDSSFQGGDFSIQGEASIMAALAVGVKRGMQVLDACAAPGGKACLMAEMMNNTGRVQAWEIRPHRTDLIAAQAKRLGLENVRPITRDASAFREDAVESMDAVLLDAPCSGLGTMADKPDIKLRVTPESVDEVTALQTKLLDTCSRYVRRGGVLVYSTCSVLKDENENQVRAFLEAHPEFHLEPLPATIPEKYRQYENMGLQLLPERDGTAGFYIARMRRNRI